MLIIAILVIGMTAGWLAHLVVEPNERSSWLRLFVIGIAGSFVGGAIGSLLLGYGFELSFSGILGATIGSLAILGVMRGIRTAG
jgi:uncharacterized membrane protein YeaQ/YmgE (transglycosylase-associated protein family)